MSEWHKVETVNETSESPDAPEFNAGSADLTPRRPRKKRSDAGKKREPSNTDAAETVSPDAADPAVEPIVTEEELQPALPYENDPSPIRYTQGGRRRGKYRFAAPLGLLVLILSVVGIISLISMGIQAIQRAQDDTPLRNELNDFLSPVMQYHPDAFSDIKQTQQDALLLAAIWRVTDTEQIRMKRENTTVSNYQIDDLGRMLIPVSEIEQSYATLFGSNAPPDHHTIGDEGKSFTTEYDADQGCYHVPMTSSTSLYVPVIDSLKKKGDTVIVRVGYVLSTKIGVDEKGNPLDPSPKDADTFQKYTVKRSGKTGWMLVSIADEKTSASSVSSTTVSSDNAEDSSVTDNGNAYDYSSTTSDTAGVATSST